MRKRAHAFIRRVAGFFYCDKCGLLALNNAVTRKAIEKGCSGAENADD